MLDIGSRNAIQLIARCLEESGFHSASKQLLPSDHSLVFGDFVQIQGALRYASPFHRFLFSVFRQGHATTERAARTFFSRDVFAALVDTGVLVRDDWGEYRTPNLALVSVQGLALVVSLPPSYPTATDRKQRVYIGPDSLSLTHALPATLRGLDVLDVCAGSGVQGLLCAARGARRVVALEVSGLTANTARFNAILNGLEDVVEVRQSDLYAALEPSDAFDFIVSNPPFMPMVEEVDFSIAGTGGVDGLDTVRPLLRGMTAHARSSFSAAVFGNVLGDSHRIFANDELDQIARDHGFQVDAIVNNKFSIEYYATVYLPGTLEMVCSEVPQSRRRELIEKWVATVTQLGAEYVFEEVLQFRRPTARPGLRNVPTYNPRETDNLVCLVHRHKATA